MTNDSIRENPTRFIKTTYRQITAPVRTLPTFLIAGAQKAGTSTLFYSLKNHPEIRMSALKEIDYFDRNYSEPLTWYRWHFPLVFDPRFKHSGEATPYYMYHPLGAKRISSTIPDVKLIFLLRNPIDRAYSNYQHELRHERENLEFSEAIQREQERLEGEKEKIITGQKSDSYNYRHYSYVKRGEYVNQIERFLNFFNKKQMLLIKSETFFNCPAKVFEDLNKFLDLSDWQPKHLPARNTGTYKESMSESVRKKLKNHFEPYNERLRQKFGEKFDWDLNE